MLTILRKVRKSIIGPGGASRYLLYAVGEIVLVVVGILIALQINNWNTQKQNDTREVVYLERLKSDVEVDRDLLILTDNIIQRKRAALLKLMDLYRTGNSINHDSLVFLLNQSRMLSFNLPQERQKATFDQLVSIGGLELFKNVELREQISQFYTYWDHTYFRMYSLQTEYGKFIFKYFTQSEFYDSVHPPKLSIQELIGDKENLQLYERLLMQEANYTIQLVSRIEPLKDKVDEFLESLENELNLKSE